MDSTNSSTATISAASPEDVRPSNRRRSTRLQVAVPIVITGTDIHGKAFREETTTISVNRHGANIATGEVLLAESEVLIENPPLRLSAKARVVGLFEKTSSSGTNQVRVELLEAKNIWGLQYPPEDWRQAPRNGNQAGSIEGEASESARAASSAPTTEPSAALAEPERANLPAANLVFSLPHEQAPRAQGERSKPEDEVEKLLRVAGLVLAKREAQIDASLQATLHNALRQIDEKEQALLALGEKLSAAASQTEAFSTQIAQINASVEELRQQTRDEADQARQSRQEISERLVNVVTEDALQKLSQNVETVISEVMGETRQRCSQEVLNLITLTEGFLARTTRELESRHSEMNAEAQRQLARMLHESIDSFEKQLEKGVQGFRESALASISSECAARTTVELERRQSEAVEQIKEQVQQTVRSALDGFQAQLHQMADNFRKSTEPALAEHCAARAAAEMQTKQSELVEQAKTEIQLALRSSVSGLQAELAQFEQGFRDFAVPALTQECIAKSTAALGGEQTALLARTQDQMQQMVNSSAETLRAEIEQTRKNLLDLALPALARECVERSSIELEQAQRKAVKQATGQIDGVARLTLDAFSEQLHNTEERMNQPFENLLKVSAEQINKHVQDTLAKARDEFAALRGSLLNEARSQILERTLPSTTEQA